MAERTSDIAGWGHLANQTADDRRTTRPVLDTDQRVALPTSAEARARAQAALAARAEQQQAKAPEGTTSFEAPPQGTASFQAPVNLRASRLLKARVKVNSTHQGTPRPTGPWTPGHVQRAIERKSNESEDVSPHAPAWPRPVDDTMEYQAFAALSKATVPVAPVLLARHRKGVPRFTKPSVDSDKLTVPLTPAPDLILQPRAPEALALRVVETIQAHEPAVATAPTVPTYVERHVAEKVIVGILMLAAAGLVWLNVM